ncbi:MAG: pilus assembly protein PilM [Lachnospiraceae bacterium]|nr:pilus assembly protein PilM [Lachnospiraceae bacterium]
MGKVISLYISNSEIRVCELEQGSKHVTVSRAFDTPILPGLVEDGMIADLDGLANAILKSLSDNGIKKGQVAFTLLSKKIAQKEIQLPYVKDVRKVADMINANLSDYFPMGNLDEYVIRYNILDTVEVEDEKKLAVQVFAFPKPMIESYKQLAEMIRMPLFTIDYYYNSFYQLLRRQMNTTGTSLAIQMSRHNTQVAIMKGRIQQFKRPIAYGRSTLVSNLMEYRNIVEQDAEMALTDPLYQEHILTPSEFQELIHNFAMSITRVVEFHTSRNPNTNVESVKLFGTGTAIPNFAEALGRELGIDIEPVREFAGIRLNRRVQKDLSYELLHFYMANIGVLFDSLDVDIKEKKESSSFTTLMVLLIVLAALINIGVFVYYRVVKQNELRNEAKNLQNSIDSLAIAEQFYLGHEAILEDYNVIEGIYKDTQSNTEMLPVFVADLEKTIPATVGIKKITVEDGEVGIDGYCGGKAALAAFVIELKKLPYVRNVYVSTANEETTDLGSVNTKFAMTLDFVYMTDEEVYKAEDFSGEDDSDDDIYGEDDGFSYDDEEDYEEENYEDLEEDPGLTDDGGELSTDEGDSGVF